MDPERLREDYRLQRARFAMLASKIATQISERLRAASILHFVTHRSKHPDDVARKVAVKRGEGKEKYLDQNFTLSSAMTDLAGVRVVVYEPEAEEQAAELIAKHFKIADLPLSESHFSRPAFRERAAGDTYRATHLLLVAPDDDPLVAGAVCEVQVCNIVAHVFNEFEHDITYKNKKAIPSDKTKTALDEVRRLTRELERAVSDLMKRHKRDVSEQRLEMNDASELKDGLESALGRTVTGEFELLFFVLQPLITPLTIQALAPAELIEHGRTLNTATNLSDATLIGLGFADDRREQVAKLLDVWGQTHPSEGGELLDALRTLIGG